MAPAPKAGFSASPDPTVFIVNVIHVHEGKQDKAFAIIQDIVHYVAERKEGFLWSSLAKSMDGQTVVNVEAISGVGDVEEFFSDPTFSAKFEKLKAFSTFEFHTYQVDDLVLPKFGGANTLAGAAAGVPCSQRTRGGRRRARRRARR